MRRWWGVVALLAATSLLGGCAVVGESRLDEFQAESESISQQIVEAVPAMVVAEEDLRVDSGGQLAPSMGDGPQTPAWWQVRTSVPVLNEPEASETAAIAVGAMLIDEGWAKAEESGSDNPVYKTDEYRRDGWYVQVGWIRSDPKTVESLRILIVSPQTVRGDHDELSS